MNRSNRLPSSLYVICDADACVRAGWTLVDFASACLEGGGRFLQIRLKHATGAQLLETATAIVRRAEPYRASVVVNDRADIARLAGAAGVHVGQDDLSPPAVRAVVGADAMVGLSTHTPEQLEAALAQQVSYVAVGPVFGSATKATGYEALGLEAIRAAARVAGPRGVPIVAIGGITLANARSVVDAGAESIAVIADLLATGDPAARVREFLVALG